MSFHEKDPLLPKRRHSSIASFETYIGSPHQFNPPHKEVKLCSFSRSVGNMSNAVLGCGILVLPYGLRVAGLSAVFLLGFSAWSSSKAYKMLVCTFHHEADMTKRQLRYNYMQVAYAVFGLYGKIALGILIRLIYTMVTAQFLELCGETIASILPGLSQNGWTVVSALIVFLLVMAIPNLKDMSWLGAVGILNAILCIITILLISVREIAKDPHTTASGISTYPMFIPEGVFFTLPMYLYSFGATFAVPSVYYEMKDKSTFPMLMDLVFLVIFLGKLIFTVTAFAAFQSNTRDIVSLNIISYTGRAIISVSIALDKLLTLPLIIYSTRREIESQLLMLIGDCNCLSTRVAVLFSRCIVTFFILIICSIIAILIPNFAILISLTGIVVIIGTLIIPIICWFVLARRKSLYDLVCASVICVILSLGSVGGIYVNIVNFKAQNVSSN